MTTVFVMVLNMSITASIVALAVMFMRIPLRKSPKIFSYALWGVVMLRLIFPFSIESIFNLIPTSATIVPPEITTSSAGIQLADVPVNAPIYSTGTIPVIEQINTSSVIISAIEVAGYIWLFGFFVLLAYAVMGYVSLKQRVCYATLVRDNIYETDRIKTPFVLGFVRPKIYFPANIDPLRHDYILRHEQIHIQRYDYLIKPFAYIVFAMHWFNPLMWIAYFLMSKDMEMSCDEAVLRRTNEDIRCDYSTSLLCLSTKRVSLLSPISSAYGGGDVKERIANVLSFNKSASWVTVVLVLVVGGLLAGFSSNRVWAIDAPANARGISQDAAQFNITSWYMDEQGARVASAEDARHIGVYLLNRYFGTFRHDWEVWDDSRFTLIMHPAFIDELGNEFTQPWTGGVFSVEPVTFDDDFYFYAPLFLYNLNTETGRLELAIYSPPTGHIMSNIAPFIISLEEAYDSFGDSWLIPALHMHRDYKGMLIDFSFGVLYESGVSSDALVSIDVVSTWSNLVNRSVNYDVIMMFASGKSVTFAFEIFEEYFSFEGVVYRF